MKGKKSTISYRGKRNRSLIAPFVSNYSTKKMNIKTTKNHTYDIKFLHVSAPGYHLKKFPEEDASATKHVGTAYVMYDF